MCLVRLVHFALDDGHGPLARGVWEAKLEALRATGYQERVAMAVFSLEKAREKVKDKEEAI